VNGDTRVVVTNAEPTVTHCGSEGFVARVTVAHDGNQIEVTVDPIVFLPPALREYELIFTLEPGRQVLRWSIHPLRKEEFSAFLALVITGFWEFTFTVHVI